MNDAAPSNTNTTDETVPGLTSPIPGPNNFNGESVIPVAIITAVLASLLVGLRVYTRVKILRAVHLDDWFILVALVFGLGTSATMIAQVGLGLGRHFFYVRHYFGEYLKSGIIARLIYTASLFSTKVSILCLYIRIFTYHNVQVLSKVLLALVVVSHTWILTSILTTCVPLESLWNMGKTPSFCHKFVIFWVNAGLNTATDFLICLLPLPVIFNLRLPQRQKLGLYFVFLLAFGVCAISAVRLASLLKHGYPSQFYKDLTWTDVPIANLNCIEVHTAIICACLTTLKPFLAQMFPRFPSRPPKSPVVNPIHRYERPLTIGTQITRLHRTPRDSFVSSIHTHEFKRETEGNGCRVQLPIYAYHGGHALGIGESYRLVDLEEGGSYRGMSTWESRPGSSRPPSWPFPSPPPRTATPDWPPNTATSRSRLVRERGEEQSIAMPGPPHMRGERGFWGHGKENGDSGMSMPGWF